MKEIPVHQLAPGDRLNDDVTTATGGCLFYRGHILTEEDVDVLGMFLIQDVSISKSSHRVRRRSQRTASNRHAKHPHSEQATKQVSEAEKRSALGVMAHTSAEHRSLTEEYKRVVRHASRFFHHIQEGNHPSIEKIIRFLHPFVYRIREKPALVLQLPAWTEKNNYIAHHAVSVAALVSLVAAQDKLDKPLTDQLILAGFLHNIGQLNVRPDILHKPTALTVEEFEEIQRHPAYGYHILKNVDGLHEGVWLATLQHHEREDGSGYPLGFKADKIHRFAKIVAIADVYYAMCAECVYKKAISPFMVAEQLRNDSFGKLSNQYVHLFLQLIVQRITVGSTVALNDGRQGKIVYVETNVPTRPIIQVGQHIVDLQQERDKHIERILPSS